ncbi:MAG: hypothetical protein K2K74_10145 [Lachnospiraceae bacterium]|nr:hypothetical protein [Lachnospiraceae bacterium]MDE6620827.1 hypothetical protein [Lachnospiraceae bacterium]
MSENKIETTKGMCVVSLTKHIMEKRELGYEDAYKKLLTTELYQLLQDSETRLFLETNEYLNEAYDRESEGGKDALYQYIQQ